MGGEAEEGPGLAGGWQGAWWGAHPPTLVLASVGVSWHGGASPHGRGRTAKLVDALLTGSCNARRRRKSSCWHFCWKSTVY